MSVFVELGNYVEINSFYPLKEVRIYGLESELVVLRINNNIYEAKWTDAGRQTMLSTYFLDLQNSQKKFRNINFEKKNTLNLNLNHLLKDNNYEKRILLAFRVPTKIL
jgi:hypothetical protein